MQRSMFDDTDLAEIRSPAYPGERLIVCRNERLAEERAHKREALLQATEALLACKFLPHLTVIPTTLDGDSYDT